MIHLQSHLLSKTDSQLSTLHSLVPLSLLIWDSIPQQLPLSTWRQDKPHCRRKPHFSCYLPPPERGGSELALPFDILEQDKPIPTLHRADSTTVHWLNDCYGAYVIHLGQLLNPSQFGHLNQYIHTLVYTINYPVLQQSPVCYRKSHS